MLEVNFVGEPHKYNGIFALFHLMNSLSFLKNVKDLWNKILKLMKILTSRYNVEELSSAPFYGGDQQKGCLHPCGYSRTGG